MTIAYRWWRRVVKYHVVSGCVDVWWILYFALRGYISKQLKDCSFLVVTSHMRQSTIHLIRQRTTSYVPNMPHLACNWLMESRVRVCHPLRWDWLVKIKMIRKFCSSQVCLRIWDLGRRLEVTFVGWFFAIVKPAL